MSTGELWRRRGALALHAVNVLALCVLTPVDVPARARDLSAPAADFEAGALVRWLARCELKREKVLDVAGSASSFAHTSLKRWCRCGGG